MASAQSTSVATIFNAENFFADYQVYASVISANPTATTYYIECGETRLWTSSVTSWGPSQGCWSMTSVTMTVGPSTFELWERNPKRPGSTADWDL